MQKRHVVTCYALVSIITTVSYLQKYIDKFFSFFNEKQNDIKFSDLLPFSEILLHKAYKYANYAM